MSFDAALVREQGITFAVVVVKGHVISSDSSRGRRCSAFGVHFPERADRVDGSDGSGDRRTGAVRHRPLPRTGLSQ